MATVGLLDDALALDLRRPQDYFGRVWATAFRATRLAQHEDHGDIDFDDEYGTDETEDLSWPTTASACSSFARSWDTSPPRRPCSTSTRTPPRRPSTPRAPPEWTPPSETVKARRAVTSGPGQTAAATAAGRPRGKITRVEKAIGQLCRERGRLAVRAIAERADVSATFPYENPDARALVQQAVSDSKSQHDRRTGDKHEQIEASWRERALNAEAELTRTQNEILVQRQRIGELMGQLRDIDQMVPGESLQHLTTENTTLKRRLQQVTQEHRKLRERLEGARTNLRFSDKRIADLEVQLLEAQQLIPAGAPQ
ncbi:hypothetical protein [Streptomyces sp. NPDC006267]|uniref:hypothetical protein n=1 Tax=Streptomyces sp. NPDC006267 TaxID=3157173 RepID=UPI0033A6ABFD